MTASRQPLKDNSKLQLPIKYLPSIPINSNLEPSSNSKPQLNNSYIIHHQPLTTSNNSRPPQLAVVHSQFQKLTATNSSNNAHLYSGALTASNNNKVMLRASKRLILAWASMSQALNCPKLYTPVKASMSPALNCHRLYTPVSSSPVQGKL